MIHEQPIRATFTAMEVADLGFRRRATKVNRLVHGVTRWMRWEMALEASVAPNLAARYVVTAVNITIAAAT